MLSRSVLPARLPACCVDTAPAALPLARLLRPVPAPRLLSACLPACRLLPEEGSNAGCSGCGRYGGWAQSGEIDVMEIANDAKQLSGTIHYGGAWPANVYSTNTTAHPSGGSFAAGFHTYRLDWSKGEVRRRRCPGCC